MLRFALVVLVTSAATTGMGAAAQAADYVINHWKCSLNAEVAVPINVAVGCEIVDASLGCPSGAALELKLQLAGLSGVRAVLQLQNPPAGLLPAVGDAIGTAHRVNQNTIVVLPGVGSVTGFVADAAPAPSLSVKVTTAATSLGFSNPQAVRLGITQVVGDYDVGSTLVKHFYYKCRGPRRSKDRIDLTGSFASTGAVALLDGNVAGTCRSVDELAYRGVPFIALPNMRGKGTCVERATIFSSRNAVAFRKDMSSWSNRSGDEIELPLDQPAEPRVKIWVLWTPCVAGTCNAERRAVVDSRPRKELEHATLLWQQAFGGFSFANAPVVDLSTSNIPGLQEEAAGLTLRCVNAGNTQTLVEKFQTWTGQTPAGYAKHLNVFYVRPFGSLGKWCGVVPCGANGDCARDTILIGADADLGTPAHEFGHAFLNSGNHADAGTDGFTADSIPNLMRSNASGEHLTLGQLFRANLLPDSSVNRHGARSGGPTASCSAAAGSLEACPELIRDVSPR